MYKYNRSVYIYMIFRKCTLFSSVNKMWYRIDGVKLVPSLPFQFLAFCYVRNLCIHSIRSRCHELVWIRARFHCNLYIYNATRVLLCPYYSAVILTTHASITFEQRRNGCHHYRIHEVRHQRHCCQYQVCQQDTNTSDGCSPFGAPRLGLGAQPHQSLIR